MKRIGLLLLLIITTVSCSSDNEDKKEVYHGYWKLNWMSRNSDPFANSAPIIEWEENYTFKSNGKFSKTRIKDGKTTTITGIYSAAKVSGQTNLNLQYSAHNDIIGTCSSSDLTENLFIVDGFEVLYNGLGACKGPAITYIKIK